MPSTNPVTGDRTMAISVLERPPQTIAENPALATPAPMIPPTSACDEDEGIPSRQVITFQVIAPISAPKITAFVTISGLINPFPMVEATLASKPK